MTILQASMVQMDPGQRVIPSAAVSGLEMPNITVLLPKSQLAGTTTQGDLITQAHFRHSLDRTQNCGSILSRI